MPEKSPQPNHSAETLNSVAGIRAGYDAAIAALAGTDPAGKIPPIMDKAIAAAKAGDQEAFESHFDDLFEVGDELMDPDLPFHVYAEVFKNDEIFTLSLAGVSVGSERSFNILGGVAISERERVRDGLKYSPDDFEMRPYDAYKPQTGVADLLTNCIKTDTPPNAWIEKAALNPMHRWTLYLEYYKQITRNGTPEQQINALSLVDGLAAELLDNNAFTPGFVQAAAKEMLEVTKKPELQLALLTLGHESIKEHPRKDPTQDIHWAADITAAYISSKQGQHTDEGYDPGLRHTTETLVSAIERMQVAGITFAGQKTVDGFMGLTAALMHMSRRDAQSLIRGIDEAMRMVVPTSGPDGDGILYLSRDRVLRQYAVLAAAADNFPNARTLLAAIFNDSIKGQTLSECYEFIKEPGDLGKIDDKGLFIDPRENPKLDRMAAEAKASNDPVKKAETMIAITEQASHNMRYRECLETLYTQLADIDPGLAERTGEQVLATFRALYNGRGYLFVKWLAEGLIRSGNMEELAHAYAQITQSEMDTATKLFHLNCILQIIDEAYPDLPARASHAAPTTDAIDTANEQDPITIVIGRILRTME